MSTPLYTVRIGEQHCFAQAVTYDVMLRLIVERTIRAALARSIDASDWEDERLRREGLEALQVCEGTKALWSDSMPYQDELEASREIYGDESFADKNLSDPDFYKRLDRDLQRLWRAAGYKVASLRKNMKTLFLELEKEAARYAEYARESLVSDIMRVLFLDEPTQALGQTPPASILDTAHKGPRWRGGSSKL